MLPARCTSLLLLALILVILFYQPDLSINNYFSLVAMVERKAKNGAGRLLPTTFSFRTPDADSCSASFRLRR
jgi:hypothetical protein